MKLTLTIIMTLPCLLTLGQTCDTINGHAINCVDSNGLRQGEWEQRKKIVLLSWYNGYGSENGCKYGEKAKYVTLAKGNYKNNKKTGTWKYCLDGDRDVIQIEKLITYYDNGTTEEQNLYYNYVTSINPDSLELNGQIFHNRDTVDINCKDKQCKMELDKDNEIISFSLDKFDYEIERLVLGVYNRKIKEIKNAPKR